MAFTQNQIGLSYPVATTIGGTGVSTYAVGDLLSATGVDTLSKLPIGTAGQVLTVAGGVSSWATPAAGAVTSVFTRSGAVVAQSGDYSFSLISGEIATTQLPGGGVNGASELVQLTGAGALPVLDGAALTGLTGSLSSVTNSLTVAVNGGTPSASVSLINSNSLSITGTTLTSNVNGVSSNASVQPLIASPTLNNFVFTDAAGRAVDNGYSLSPSENDASATAIMSAYYVQLAIANQVTSAKSFRGGFDASGGLFPSTGGSGTAGAVAAGDVWVVTTAGTLGGTFCDTGATLLALVAVPGQTASNWAININGVASVFGRSGVVSAQSGDYSFSLISGTALVGQGGTGLTTPGASGNVLTSNGTTWVSSTPVSAPVSSVFARTGTVVAVYGDYTQALIAPSFVAVTASTQALAANTSYYSTFAGLCTATLPATMAAGEFIEFLAGPSGNTFRIAQNSGQQIVYGALAGVSQATTVGSAGYIQSTDPNTTVLIKCVVANTSFMVVSAVNALTGN